MLLVLVLAVSLGWMIHEVRKQRTAVAALEKMGCSVQYSRKTPTTVLQRMRKLLGEDERSVRWVIGQKSQITDAGLVHLGGLTQPEWLTLNATQVTDAGLVHLRGLTHLRFLSLDDTQVTDAGLTHLEELTLRQLNLQRTQVTDAGLVHLRGMHSLLYLGLSGTKVTDAGAGRLQKALPKCQMSH